jgi:flagellar assembly protein FliH
MAKQFKLETFDLSGPIARDDAPAGLTQAAPDDLESVKVSAYEQGYSAGWEDAAQSAESDKSRISTEFAHNLQDLGFTFHEARSHVIRSLHPLLEALVGKLLPELSAQTIGQRIIEEFVPLAETAADTPIQIEVAPGNSEALQPFLDAHSNHPFELREEPSLSPGQVYLRSGSTEKHIDLVGALSNIQSALNALHYTNKEAFSNGKR